MKNFWPIFFILCLVTGVVFAIIINALLQGDTIEYTDLEPIEVPTILKTDPVLGIHDPTIVIVAYSDFTCEGCAQTASALSSMVAQYPEDITVIWKDFPNTSLNEEAYTASIAARCAQKQDSFWEYHDMLMTNQRLLNGEIYSQIAEDLDLGMWRFNRCVRRESTSGLVDASYEEGLALEIAATPTLFINGERYAGTMKEIDLKQILFETVVR